MKDSPQGGMSIHWRRTFRLVLALVVVLVVMRQASDPTLYHAFFPAKSVAFAGMGQPPPATTNDEVASVATWNDALNLPTDSQESGIHLEPGKEGPLAMKQKLTMAMATVEDGTTWRPGDKAALQIMRHQAQTLDNVKANGVSVLALLQQPESYVGQIVRVRGRVARCDAVEDYFQLWLKPSDGSNRPIIAIVDRVPKRFDRIGTESEPVGPSVTIVARFLKRLAYRSVKGADVAPVVVGRIDRVPGDYLDGDELAVAQDYESNDQTNVRILGLLAFAGVLGVALAGALVWRSGRQRSEMRQRRQRSLSKNLDLPKGVFWLLAFVFAPSSVCIAESVLPMLGKFDRQALELVYPVKTTGDASNAKERVGEMAKLLYQINRLQPASLKAAIDIDQADAGLGDVVSFSGSIASITKHDVPPTLVAYLEFPRFYRVAIVDDASETTSVVIVNQLPSGVRRGDHVRGVGVSVLGKGLADQSEGMASVSVAPRLQWSPKSFDSQGWQLLSQTGFDLSLIDVIRKHARQPLSSGENDAFFSMLASTEVAEIGTRVPKRVPLVDLLSRSNELAGDWLRLNAEALRVTKIYVGDAAANSLPLLAADHYYQIDAIGDLGQVVVKIEPSEPGGTPLEMDGRYPISIVTTKLPAELEPLASGESVPSDRRRDIVVDALFYRLWSYSSDLSSRDPRSSDQLGPLLFATSVHVPAPLSADPIGVRRIGWIICTILVVGFLLILWWNHRSKKLDAKTRRPTPPMQAIDLGDSL